MRMGPAGGNGITILTGDSTHAGNMVEDQCQAHAEMNGHGLASSRDAALRQRSAMEKSAFKNASVFAIGSSI